MGKMILYGVVILASFSLAAAGSWYLNRPAEDASEDTADGDSETPKSDQATANSEATGDGTLIPSAATPQSFSAEDAFRFGQVMKKREEDLRRAREELEKIAKRNKLIQQDIDAEQKEIDGLFTQIQGSLEATAARLKQLQETEQRVAAAAAEREKAGIPSEDATAMPDAAEMKNLKRLATIHEAMAPEKSAELLTKMANDGQFDRVVWILSGVSEKTAAKILGVMPDLQLAVRVTEKMALLQHPEKPKGRR